MLAGADLPTCRSNTTAFVACDDMRAYHVYDAAQARGLAVGKDVSVVAYGTIYGNNIVRQRMTRVAVDVPTLGHEAMRCLQSLRFGEEDPGQLIKLPAQLVIGESTAPPPSE